MSLMMMKAAAARALSFSKEKNKYKKSRQILVQEQRGCANRGES